METVKVPPSAIAGPPVCFARPALLNGLPNPMVYCTHPPGHEGKHSWEQ